MNVMMELVSQEPNVVMESVIVQVAKTKLVVVSYLNLSPLNINIKIPTKLNI